MHIGKSGNIQLVKEEIDDYEKKDNEGGGSTESDQFLEQFVEPKSFQNEDDIEQEPKDYDEDSKLNDDDDSSKAISEKSTDEIYEEVEDRTTSQNGKWKSLFGIFQKNHDNEQEPANDDEDSKLDADDSSKATSEKSTHGDAKLIADDSSKATSEKSSSGDSKLIADDSSKATTEKSTYRDSKLISDGSSKAKSEKSPDEIYEEEDHTSQNGKWKSLFGMIIPKTHDNEQEPENDDRDSNANGSFKVPYEDPTDKIDEELEHSTASKNTAEEFEMINHKEVGLKPVERRNININIVNTRYETTMSSENENNWMVLTSTTTAVIVLCMIFVIIGMVLYSNQMLFYI